MWGDLITHFRVFIACSSGEIESSLCLQSDERLNLTSKSARSLFLNHLQRTVLFSSGELCDIPKGAFCNVKWDWRYQLSNVRRLIFCRAQLRCVGHVVVRGHAFDVIKLCSVFSCFGGFVGIFEKKWTLNKRFSRLGNSLKRLSAKKEPLWVTFICCCSCMNWMLNQCKLKSLWPTQKPIDLLSST